jgi:inner membrane protein
MDPLAHTLVGAALAETGLERRTALGTATLLIGANLPDVDAVAALAGEDTALLLRRGVTHGIVALLVLPWLLAGAMLLFDRWRRRRGKSPPGTPADFRALLALSYLGVLSHPFLDWLNTYGVRVLSPFSDRWFYGDTLFILDPWMWLLAGCAVVLAHARVKASAAGWLVIGGLTTALVLLGGAAPALAQGVWCAAVAALVLARWRLGPRPEVAALARGALLALALYIAAMFGGARFSELQAQAWAEARGWTVETVIANPLPAHPSRRELVLALPDRYEFATVGWFAAPRVASSGEPLPRLPVGEPVVEAALGAPEVRGFRNWMRFPSAQVESHLDGYRVTLYDVRYARPDTEPRGIGRVTVELDAQLRPR